MATIFAKMTRASMRRLPSGGRIVEHGIEFVRTKNGDGVFTVNVMVDGQRVHRVVGRESDGTTRTQAEEFIAKIRADAKHDRLCLPRGRKVALGFRRAAKKYLVKLEEEGGKDIAAKKRRLDQHLIPFFADAPLTKISSFDVERYKKHRCTEKAMKSRVKRNGKEPESAFKETLTCPGTVNRELAVLSHLMNKVFEWGWIDRIPLKIKRLREGGGRITYLTVDQAKKLLKEAEKDENPQIFPFIRIGLATSMRLMEILSIRKDNVDLARRVIFVPQAKAGQREQPITTELAEYLKLYIATLAEETPWLFPSPSSRSRTGHTTNVRKAYRRVVKAADLDPDQIVRHTLRHTAITHLVQAGVDLPTVKRISGHKTLIMVERYAHANGDHIQAAMDKLEQRYSPDAKVAAGE